MRIRSTKPEFWRSERITSVDWEARLVLKGLESYVDDNGVGRDDLALIVGDIFQRDLVREPSRTLARVSEALTALHEAGLLWRYDHEGTALLYISFWDQVQRVDKPQAGRNPRPDGTHNYKDSVIRECIGTPREGSRTFAPGTGEQGNSGTGDQGAEEQGSSSEVAVAPSRPDVDRLLDLLDAEIVRNGGKRPTRSKKNVDAMRLLLDRDERTPEQVERAILWCQADSFWRGNILSAVALRASYDKLRLHAAREQGRAGRPSAAERGLTLVQELEEREHDGQEALGA
jgi:hypothetical protein